MLALNAETADILSNFSAKIELNLQIFYQLFNKLNDFFKEFGSRISKIRNCLVKSVRILDKDVINDFWLTKFQNLGNVTQVKDINITREIQKDPLCGGWMEISQRMDTSQRAQRSNPAESTRKITLKNWGRRKVTNQVHRTIVSRSSKDEQHAPEAVKEIEKNVRENKKKNPVTGWRKKRRSSSFLFHFLLGQTSSFTEGQVPIVSNSTATRLQGKSRFSLFF